MKKINPALLLYVVCSLMYVLSVVFHWDKSFVLLFKPMVMPAILIYYRQESKVKISIIPVLILILFFIGDMLVLFDFENLLLPLMLFNLLAFFLIGYCLVKDMLMIKKPEISWFMLLIVCIVVGFLLSFLYTVLKLVFDDSYSNYALLTIYCFTLLFLGVGTVVYYMLKNNSASFYLLISMLCLVLCDLFFVLYYNYESLDVFKNINVIAQSVSFYFLVNYFLARE